MIAIDSNLLLYAYNPAAREYERARAWFESVISSAPAVGFPLVSILGFLRIATDRRLPDAARTTKDAVGIVGRWLERKNVSVLEPGARHWPIFFDVLLDSDFSGPRVTDAHLAALAIEHGATLYTNDRDFRLFPRLDVRFPLIDGI